MSSRGSVALEGMYVLAALLMGLGSLFVVVMMFVPSDIFDRRDRSSLYLPGAMPAQPVASRPAILDEPAGVREVAPGRFEVTMRAYNWRFEPTEIRVPAGAEVTFRAHSIEDYHGIMILGTDVVLSLIQNEVSEARYTFTEPGEYLFICSEYCGAEHGSMNGKVIVE
jgi:heme/copper-type cytochrome/quinol oxidase subunit 2